MELIEIGKITCGLEDVFAGIVILSIFVGIISLAMVLTNIFDTYNTEEQRKRAKWLALPIFFGLLAGGLAITNSNIPSVTTYTYHVTDMEQLSDMVNNGWTVSSYDGSIYTLTKGE